jgi:hypothetical protein
MEVHAHAFMRLEGVTSIRVGGGSRDA